VSLPGQHDRYHSTTTAGKVEPVTRVGYDRAMRFGTVPNTGR